ncbi:MAG: LptF/LptG family permease [Gemmatimonadaceae bacterium]|nr:LptF/LptG family permease [Gemmatimonadaceae bacterium]
MKIVSRYVLKEHLGPLVFALSALTSLLLLNFVAKRFGDLVGKGLPWTVIAEFLLLSVPFTLAMTLPMAVLVATLHAFSRLASENEITAFKASGVSMQRLVRPVIIASAFLTFFMIWFNDQVLPRANHRLANLQSSIARVKPTLALNEQVINEVVPRQLFLRAGRIAAGTNQMRDVTIFDLSEPTQRRTIIADSGYLAFSATGEDLLLTLYHGGMTSVEAAKPERLQRSFFDVDIFKVRGVAARLERADDRRSFRSDREMSVCELQERVSTSSAQRDTAWVRLAGAEARAKRENARSAEPPGTPLGVGEFYCAALRTVGGWFSPEEAIAATLDQAPDKVKQVIPPSAGARIAAESEVVQDPTVQTMMIEGLAMELQIAQGTIDRHRVEIEKKFAIATACIVFVLLGAPIALRFPRGGVGLTIGVSLGVFGIYYVGLLGGEALADRDLVDPALAMWFTNILLGIVGVILTARLGSEGSTARGSETSEWWNRILERFRRKRGVA